MNIMFSLFRGLENLCTCVYERVCETERESIYWISLTFTQHRGLRALRAKLNWCMRCVAYFSRNTRKHGCLSEFSSPVCF